jgi:hypothetical protein
MAPISRRKFLATSALGAGLLNAGTGMQKLLAQTQSGSFIVSNFNGTPLSGGDFVWFNSVLKVKGLNPTQLTTINFASLPITFVVDGVTYSIPVPSSVITFMPGLVLATTDFVDGQWVTNVPASGLAGNAFLDGVAFEIPANGLPGGIKNVTWAGMFSSCAPGLTVQWQWAAAVYRYGLFPDQDLGALGVKPVDDNQASSYKNADHAGTPEYFRAYVVGGARGGGGSNFTGSYSGTGSSVPSLASSCGGGS